MCVVVDSALPGGARCGGTRWAFAVRMRGSGRRTTQRAIVPDEPDPAEIARTTVDPSRHDHLAAQPGRGAGGGGAVRLVPAGLDQQGRRPGRASAGLRRPRAGAPSSPSARRPARSRCSCSRASGGISAISSVGTYGAFTAQQVDPAAQIGRQGVVQVTLVDLPRRHVAPRARDRGRVEVGGVQLEPGRCVRRSPPRSRRCRSTGRPRPVAPRRPGSRRRGRPAPRSAAAGRTLPAPRRSGGRRTPPSRRPAPAAHRPPAAPASASRSPPARASASSRAASSSANTQPAARSASTSRGSGSANDPQPTTLPRSTMRFGSASTVRSSSGSRS